MTATAVKQDEELLLTPEETAQLLKVTTRTLWVWRNEGTGPDFVQVSPRTIRYPRFAIARWLAEHLG